MMRRYHPEKTSHLQLLPTDTTVQTIPLDAKLYSIQTASKILNDQFERGFSTREIRRLIASSWVEGWHFVRRGKLIKIYLPAVQQWVMEGES